MTNAADVFVFWLAITSTLKDLFSKSECVTGITETLKRTHMIATLYC